jgi:hypothetical protein
MLKDIMAELRRGWCVVSSDIVNLVATWHPECDTGEFMSLEAIQPFIQQEHVGVWRTRETSSGFILHGQRPIPDLRRTAMSEAQSVYEALIG